MGFDQYHEPPEELPGGDAHLRAPVRLADRGGRGDRLVRAAPRGRARPRGAGDHARRPGRGVQALQHGPRVPAAAHAALARDRRGRPLPARRHRRARRGGRGGAARRGRRRAAASRSRGRLARHRQPAGERSDEPPAALARADHRRRLGAARRRGARAPDRRARGAPAGRLRRPARLGALGDEPRPHGGARRRRRRGRRRGRSGACCRWSSCAPTSRSRAPSCATHDRGAPDVDLDAARRAPRSGSRSPRTSPSSTAGRRPASPASPRPRRTKPIALGEDAERLPAPRSPRAVELLLRSGIDGPVRAGARPRGVHARVETAEHGGYPLLDHLRKILGGPIVWAPGGRAARWSSSLRGGDFLLRVAARTSRSATTATTPRPSHLYLEESFSFRVATPEAAVALSP